MKIRHGSFMAPKSLFRRISPNLLHEYLHSRFVLDGFDWDAFAANRWQLMDDLVEEYYKLPSERRGEIEEELRQINALSTLSAQETLEAVAKQNKLLWDDEMMPEDRAIRVLMENREVFAIAFSWSQLENYASFSDYLAGKSKDAKDWTKISQALTDSWKLLLQNRSKGFGRVYIEHYSAGDSKNIQREAYLVYYEAPGKLVTRFDDQTDMPEDRSEKPVLEALMIYYPAQGKLKVKARTPEMAEEARDNYSKLALGDENFLRRPDNERTYDLSIFKKKQDTLDFPTDPADRIGFVKVTSLRFNSDPLSNDIIEINSMKNLKDRVRRLKLDLSTAEIKRVRMQVKFEGAVKGLSKAFSLSLPNRNTLGDSKKDELIEKYLVKWGIANR